MLLIEESIHAEKRSYGGTISQGRSNHFTKRLCDKCMAPRESAAWYSSTKEGTQGYGPQDEPHSSLRAADMTDYFCFDSFNCIIACIGKSDLRHEIKILSNNSIKWRKLTRSSPPLLPPYSVDSAMLASMPFRTLSSQTPSQLH